MEKTCCCCGFFSFKLAGDFDHFHIFVKQMHDEKLTHLTKKSSTTQKNKYILTIIYSKLLFLNQFIRYLRQDKDIIY